MATDMFYGASPQLFENAKQLRLAMTPAEKLLWEELKESKLHGFRFKAQHPIAYFVADFFCYKARLVVELDGGVHNIGDQPEYDLNRTSVLNEFGLTVIRFNNDEVFHQKAQVLQRISEYLLSAISIQTASESHRRTGRTTPNP